MENISCQKRPLDCLPWDDIRLCVLPPQTGHDGVSQAVGVATSGRALKKVGASAHRTIYCSQERWERPRRRRIMWGSCLRTLSRPQHVRELCRPSTCCAGNWTLTQRTTAASTAVWRWSSPPGRPKHYGLSWIRGCPIRNTRKAKPVRAPR